MSADLEDASTLEAAAAIIQRRYPGTRPDKLDAMITSLQWIAQAIRRKTPQTEKD